jgi:methylmalonyl-CoA mutase N-terminal domain/subunit
VVVGVNRFATGEPAGIPLLAIDPETERRQAGSVRAVREARDARTARAALDAVAGAARDGSNLVLPIIAAVEARSTLGEISDALRSVFGEHRDAQI